MCFVDERRVQMSPQISHLLHNFNICVQGWPGVGGKPAPMFTDGGENLGLPGRYAAPQVMKVDHHEMKNVRKHMQNSVPTHENKQVVSQRSGNRAQLFHL